MIKRIQYSTNAEREAIFAENKDLICISEENITEGNFLTFSDSPPQAPIVMTPVDISRIENIEKVQAQAVFALVQGGLM